MVDTTNFIIRKSGRKDARYYIDYIGHYKAEEISKAFKIDIDKLNGIYLSNGGELDPEFEIYYFREMINAQKAISDIFSSLKKKGQGRAIILTESEIGYIRNALINEAGFAAINNKLKDGIFKKLNG